MSKAEACFWANHQNYTGVGNVRKKLVAWSSGAISVACFGCCSWHVTCELMLSVQRWEFRWLRKVLRLRRKPQESLEQYNRRTFGFISDLSQGCRHRLMHHRVLAQVFKHAWRERKIEWPGYVNHLRCVRRQRDRMWWEGLKGLSYHARVADNVVRAQRGPRAEWEDLFVLAFGLDWRSILDRSSC